MFDFSGGAFPFTIGRIEHGFNVRPDLCAVENDVGPRKYLGKFYTDTLVHDQRALSLLVDVIGKVGWLIIMLDLFVCLYLCVCVLGLFWSCFSLLCVCMYACVL